jgi:hypothetical protein
MPLKMVATQDQHPQDRRQDSQPDDAESRLESSGEVVVQHYATPPKGPGDKQIHPRRPLPLVPTAPPRPTKERKKDV